MNRGPGRLAGRVAGLGRSVYASLAEYVTTVRVSGESDALQLVRDLAAGGPLAWAGLGLVVASIFATAYLRFRPDAFAWLSVDLWQGETVTAQAPALLLSLLALAGAAAYTLAGSAALGLGAYVVVAGYVAYFLGFVAYHADTSLWYLLLPGWLYHLGLRSDAARPSRFRVPLLAALCWLTARTAYDIGAVRALLRAPLAVPTGEVAVPLLTLVLLMVTLSRSPRPPRPLRLPGATALGALILSGFVACAWLQLPRDAVLFNAFVTTSALFSLVALYCFWMGASLVGDAEALAV